MLPKGIDVSFMYICVWDILFGDRDVPVPDWKAGFEAPSAELPVLE